MVPLCGGLVAHRQWLCSRGEWFIFCLDFREFKSKKSDNFATVHGCAAKLSFSKNPRDLRNYFLENNFFTSEKTCQIENFKLKCLNMFYFRPPKWTKWFVLTRKKDNFFLSFSLFFDLKKSKKTLPPRAGFKSCSTILG